MSIRMIPHKKEVYMKKITKKTDQKPQSVSAFACWCSCSACDDCRSGDTYLSRRDANAGGIHGLDAATLKP